jgi:hypothetical protein
LRLASARHGGVDVGGRVHAHRSELGACGGIHTVDLLLLL